VQAQAVLLLLLLQVALLRILFCGCCAPAAAVAAVAAAAKVADSRVPFPAAGLYYAPLQQLLCGFQVILIRQPVDYFCGPKTTSMASCLGSSQAQHALAATV
jgi:hypothetical protein